MIDTIIFDLGGVVIAHRRDLMPHIMCKVFGLDVSQGKEVWRTYKHALLTGELPSREFLQRIKSERVVPDSVDILMDKWKKAYETEARELNVKLLKIIDALRKTHKIYLMTDTFDIHHEFNAQRGLYSHFDEVFTSHLEGKSKSQGSATFAHFLTKFKLQAETCVFIDDMESYVELANTVGIHGILFTTNDLLLQSLSQYGVIDTRKAGDYT